MLIHLEFARVVVGYSEVRRTNYVPLCTPRDVISGKLHNQQTRPYTWVCYFHTYFG